MRNILVSDVMTRDPIIIKPDATLLECAKKMVKKRVGSLLLVNKKELIGFISQKDILWALIKKSKDDLSSIKAIDISPKKIAIIKPSATIEEVLKKMKKLKFKKLPVIYDKKLVGVITVKDILNFSPELYSEIEEFTRVREETEKLKRVKDKNISEGMCEGCGNHDILQRFNGMLVCESCRDSI